MYEKLKKDTHTYVCPKNNPTTVRFGFGREGMERNTTTPTLTRLVEDQTNTKGLSRTDDPFVLVLTFYRPIVSLNDKTETNNRIVDIE